MECNQCGNAVVKSDQFCGSCGASVSSDITDVSFTHKGQISFITAVNLGFSRYFDFMGRSTRAECWWWVLFMVLVEIIKSVFDAITGIYNVETPIGLFGTLFSFLVLIPSFAVGARRLHDINRSGWWQLMLLGFFLIVPVIVLIWWAVKPSYPGTNKYDEELIQAGE